MLLVKTRIGPSPIHGIGLFAAEFIKAGTPIWVFHQGFDQKYEMSAIDSLPPSCRDQILNYGYVNPRTGLLVLCMDDARFFNHSDDPTTCETDAGEEGMTIASRDIQEGEEITYDYFENDADGPRKLGYPTKKE
jgi:hypothetical protein